MDDKYKMIAIDKDLHRKVKQLCAIEGRTMGGLVTKLLQEYIAKANKEG